MAEAGHILLICDDEAIASFLREKLIIDGGFAVSFASNGEEGLRAIKENSFDLILVTLGLAHDDNKELIKGLRKVDPDSIIVALVSEGESGFINEILRLGVYSVITKPLNLEKLFFLIKKGIELHMLMVTNRKLIYGLQEQNISLQKQNTLLAKRIEESTKNLSRLYEDLRSTYMRTIKVLAQAIDARDHFTHSHSQNVSRVAVVIAEEMGLSVKDIELVREACELHDLGKIGIEDSILVKPSYLTEEEWDQIRRHPTIGAQILEPLTFLDGVIDLVRQHHERFDGKGYPQGLKGEDILLGARIINVADSYEAMRSARSYRKAPFSKDEAIAEIKANAGQQFDPAVVEAFLKVVDEL